MIECTYALHVCDSATSICDVNGASKMTSDKTFSKPPNAIHEVHCAFNSIFGFEEQKGGLKTGCQTLKTMAKHALLMYFCIYMNLYKNIVIICLV